MPRTIDGVEAFARDPANKTRDGKSWSGWCESFVWRSGGFTGSFGSALLAGNASGTLDPNWQSAQRGELHYWSGVGGNGHVAWELGGGLLLMASASVTDFWGVDMGTVPFRTYALKGIPYRGHTFRHGSESLSRLTLSSLASVPLAAIIPPQEDNDMPIPFLLNGKHQFSIMPGVGIAHLMEGGEFAKDVFVADDKWLNFGTTEFLWLLDACGIPRDVVVGTSGKQKSPITGIEQNVEEGMVFDPEAGVFRHGGFWSWERLNRAGQGVLNAKLDTLASALKGLQLGGVDLAAVTGAAEAGAKTGVAGLKIPTEQQIAAQVWAPITASETV